MLRKNLIVSQNDGVTRSLFFFSLHRPWIYTSIACAIGLFVLVNIAVMPLIVQGYTASITPTVAQAKSGPATANVLKDLNEQNLNVENLGHVSHPYLMGRGTLVGFMGDNIQIFEYPNAETARTEASAIIGRSPRLATERYFHLYRQGNLIGLYFGYNAEVLKAIQEEMGNSMSL